MKEIKPERIRYSYHRWLLAKRFTSPHILCIARTEKNGVISFGWSLCIPSRWETRFGKTIDRRYIDTVTKKEVSEEEYKKLIELCKEQEDKIFDDCVENDGELIIIDEATEKLASEAEKKILDIGYHKNIQKTVTKTLIKGDMFSKKRAREIAIQRLAEEPICIKSEEGKYAIESIMDFLRNSKDFPRALLDIAELEHQMMKVCKLDSVYSATPHKPLQPPTLLEKISSFWKLSGLWRATYIVGGLLFGYLLGLVLCACLS